MTAERWGRLSSNNLYQYLHLEGKITNEHVKVHRASRVLLQLSTCRYKPNIDFSKAHLGGH